MMCRQRRRSPFIELICGRRPSALVAFPLLALFLLLATFDLSSFSAVAGEASGGGNLPNLGYDEEDEDEEDDEDYPTTLSAGTPEGSSSSSFSSSVSSSTQTEETPAGGSFASQVGQQVLSSFSQAAPYLETAKDFFSQLYTQSKEKVSSALSDSREKFNSFTSSMPEALKNRPRIIPEGLKSSVDRFMAKTPREDSPPRFHDHQPSYYHQPAPRKSSFPEDEPSKSVDASSSSSLSDSLRWDRLLQSSRMVQLLNDARLLFGSNETLHNLRHVLQDYRKLGRLDFTSPSSQDLLQKLAVLTALLSSVLNSHHDSQAKSDQSQDMLFNQFVTSNLPYIISFLSDFLSSSFNSPLTNRDSSSSYATHYAGAPMSPFYSPSRGGIEGGERGDTSHAIRKEDNPHEAAVDIVSQALQKLKDMSSSGVAAVESKYEDILSRSGLAKGRLYQTLQNGLPHGTPVFPSFSSVVSDIKERNEARDQTEGDFLPSLKNLLNQKSTD